MPHGRLIAKEFITHWETQTVMVRMDQMPPQKARFYDRNGNEVKNNWTKTETVLPDNISHLDLSSFIGKKTKVTIEILPE